MKARGESVTLVGAGGRNQESICVNLKKRKVSSRGSALSPLRGLTQGRSRSVGRGKSF